MKSKTSSRNFYKSSRFLFLHFIRSPGWLRVSTGITGCGNAHLLLKFNNSNFSNDAMSTEVALCMPQFHCIVYGRSVATCCILPLTFYKMTCMAKKTQNEKCLVRTQLSGSPTLLCMHLIGKGSPCKMILPSVILFTPWVFFLFSLDGNFVLEAWSSNYFGGCRSKGLLYYRCWFASGSCDLWRVEALSKASLIYPWWPLTRGEAKIGS